MIRFMVVKFGLVMSMYVGKMRTVPNRSIHTRKLVHSCSYTALVFVEQPGAC